MVYRSEKSASPPLRELSRSPPPEAAANAGPSQRRGKLTFADKRRMEVEKLLSNPDRQVALPQATKEKTLRAPQELVKNVQPTASAAGSGEFHVYKHARRREAERLKIMDDKAKALEEQAEFQARRQAWDAEADAKTAKNRAKRQKRKQGRKGGGAGGGGGEDDDGRGNGATGEPKRKLAGGGASVLAKPTEDGEGEGDIGVAGRPTLRIPVPGDGVERGEEDEQRRAEAAVVEAKPRAIETSIVIRDDD